MVSQIYENSFYMAARGGGGESGIRGEISSNGAISLYFYCKMRILISA